MRGIVARPACPLPLNPPAACSARAGLVESARQRGPRQFVAGVASGTRELVANVVFAFSNAATKASGAARKFIVVLGLDR